MANTGLGNKFVSVNLNKSYGQPPASHHSFHPSPYGSNRSRPGSHGGSGGGGGGMVVLSRPRSSQKTGAKLSVPPPLNLPSLRKEHERFDSLGSNAGPAGGGVSRTGQKSTSGSMGWTKPGTISLQEKEEFGHSATNGMIDQALNSVSDGNKGTSVYTPPSARPGMAGSAIVSSASVSMSSRSYPTVDKATTVLRGEDFPSLQAALPSASGPSQKQKDGLNKKQKQAVGEPHNEDGGSSRLGSHVDMRPQSQLPHHRVGNGENENRGEVHSVVGPLSSDNSQKQEDLFPGPLPLVQLNPRSNWAEDERDTGHGFTEKGKDHGFSKSEAYWDADFDMPRINSFPHKPAHSVSARWGQHDNGIGKIPSSEVPRVDSFGRDVRMPSREGREGNFWRNSPLHKDGFNASENGVGVRTSNLNRETNNDNKYVSPYRDNAHENIGRRDVGYGHGGRQPWNKTVDSYSIHGTERMRDGYGIEQHNRHRFDVPQNRSPFQPSYLSGSKGLPVTDPLLNFGRDKRPITKNEKPYSEDPFSKDFGGNGFDGRDPFTGGLLGVLKRKKDVIKQTDFHDPVRESFEAELERVQKMQEQERQHIIEEQDRILELARREEDERTRLAREQEETQKKLEAAAREAAWRAEQEQMDAMQKAEEQRIALEEEKRRIAMEEERRKQAAKQKLLELEERMARRKVESVKSGSNALVIPEEKTLGMGKEKDVSKVVDVDGDWEDGERMVERITTSASSESSSLNRSFQMGSRSQFSKGGSSGFVDRGKPVNSWRRDFNENGSTSAFFPQDPYNGGHSPRRDSSMAGRAFSRKELHGGSGFMSDPPADDYTHLRGQRWNFSVDGDHFDRNMGNDSKFPENVENFGDLGWGQGHNHGNLYSPYPERLCPDSEADGAYSFGRARYSMRQPRVLPPPTLATMHKSSHQAENERHGPSTFVESEMQYNPSARNDSTMQAGYNIHQENLGQPAITDMHHENTENEMQKANRSTAEQCDSQSTLSVSSPPSSPAPLSHDDLDESDPLVLSSREGKALPASILENQAVDVSGKEIIPASAAASTGDEDEWSMENNEHLQEQEEYDEDEDGYREEDEVHEGDDENLDLNQEFEDMHSEEKESSHMIENLVLGFNEGVEVGMPNDEFERISGNEDSMQGRVEVSREEKGSFEGLQDDKQKHQSLDDSSQVSVEDSSRIFHKTDNAIQDLVIQPHNAPQANVSSSSLLYVQQPVSSSVIMASQSSSGQAAMSNASSLGSQTEVPVKLQFGLFSGPSLIPSPVPAIQIGSIQMPLHLHPQISPSLNQMHPSHSQPPLFQFGQLRYTSSANQGVVPLAPQSVSFIHPNVQGSFPSGQNLGGALSLQPAHNQPGAVSRPLKCQINLSAELSSIPSRENIEHTVIVQQGRADISGICDNSVRSGLDSQDQTQGRHSSALNNVSSSAKESGVQPQIRAGTVDSVLKERDFVGSKARGQVSGGRGKRYVFTVKGPGSRSSFPASDDNDSSGLQRRPRRNTQLAEFRVRETMDKRQYNGNVSSNNHYGFDDRSNVTGRVTTVSARSGPRNVGVANKLSRQMLEPENFKAAPYSSRELNAGNWVDKGSRIESLTKNRNIPRSGEGNLKRNVCSEEEVDAPLQSGVVRVFEQPGIEAPSDEDDFIEVRSKRQMLNDRREQREKEVKAKYRVSKIPRKPRAAPKSANVSANLSKISSAKDGEAPNRIRSDFVAPDGGESGKIEVSSGFNTNIMAQQLAPIGTPAVKSDPRTDIRSQSLRSIQRSALPLVDGGKNLEPGSIFDSKNDVLDSVQLSYSTWSTTRINQQVMNLTQTQLDEAMKPAHFASHPPVGEHTTSVTDSNMTSSSILPKDKSFSSTTNPIDSLLAGEKIQFGAVTSPTILPASNRAILHGIGPPGPSRSEIKISHAVPGSAENERHSLFDKEKHTSESCTHLEDSEAEAEAAASAVAVAAISSDETVSTGLGLGSCSVSVSDTPKFGSLDINGIPSGSAVDQRSISQSRAEESLSVALPADLSVETLPISLWPPLPSPQNSSSQMLSHFPGGAPSHFPFYEINPHLGGPMVAYGPHDESASTPQSQPLKSSAPSSGPLGTWKQCHSGVDSFYGPPAGFTGPFISPGGIPGVQGPPHMVVYNHFAPVGQFGQVGLSFVGATYIPSGKQPDWKHNPTSTNLSGEGDMSNMNMASGQRNQTSMPPPVQHLAPGSSLLPMASPLAMFDVSPFQPSPDLARWPHAPPSSMQSMHMSMLPQQQAEAILPSQFTHEPSINQSLSANSFPNSQASTEKNCNFSIATDSIVTQLPDELGIVDVSSSIGSAQNATAKNSAIVSKTNALSSHRECSNGQNTGFISKTHLSQNKGISNQQQYRHHSSGYNKYQRGGNGASHKNTSGGDSAHRRMGFQGRYNQSSVNADNRCPSKVKQIYVAKQTSSGSSSSAPSGT